MNLNKFGRWSGIVAAVAMLAMVLQGCGGDDSGSGISQDMYDALQAELDATEADLDMAEDAAAEADRLRMMAVTARDEALDARDMANTRADDAEEARQTAENLKNAADSAAMIAMQAEEDAKAAQKVAQDALADVEAMRDMYQQGQMDAEADRDMYMEAAEDADAAAMEAARLQKVAEDALTEANTARDIAREAERVAKAAEMEAITARDDYKDKLDKANERIAELEKAMMEDDEAADAAAEAAQRARVDAGAIRASSGTAIARDLNGDGLIEPSITFDLNGNGNTTDPGETMVNERTAGSITPLENYQGSQPRPPDMSLTASHDGSMVTFTATQRVGRATEKLIDLTVAAGNGSTSGMTIVEGLPGGHDKDITLMTDIMSPVVRSFTGDNIPDGLDTATPFHADSQTYRYEILQRTYAAGTGAVSITAGTNTGTGDMTNIDLDPYIEIELGSFAPTTATPTQTVVLDGQLPGSYGGVPGTFRCSVIVTGAGGCTITAPSGETLINGGWEFVPESLNVSIADSDFLVFGAWLKRPQSQVGVGYSAGISSTSMPYDNSPGATNDGVDLNDLGGTATYKGHAAGHFAERFIGTDEAKSGRFTATAELSANFDPIDTTATPPDIDEDVPGTISGSITDFVRDDGVAANWVVSLGQTSLDGATDTGPGGFVMGDTGGHAAGANWTGQWGVELAGAGGNEEHPTGVVGTFGAAFGSPSQLTDELDTGELAADEGFVGVIGGFGARKE